MEKQGDVNLYFILFAGTAGMFILAAAIIVFMLVYQRRMARHQQQIQEARMQHQLDLLHRNIQTQESERKRMARDLHDEAGTLLAAIRLYLAEIAGKGDSPRVVSLAEEGKDLVDKTIQSIRAITHDLLPAGLDIFGLSKTLGDTCNQLAELSGLKIVFTGEQVSGGYDTDLALYRIAKELLNNTLKHAGATEVHLALGQTTDRLVMEYRDNGRGFEVRSLQEQSGLGLKNIESRVSLVRGSMQLTSSPGSGMQACITIPS